MELSRQEYWSGLSFPPPGDLPNPGIKLESPSLQLDSLLSEPLDGMAIHLPRESHEQRSLAGHNPWGASSRT